MKCISQLVNYTYQRRFSCLISNSRSITCSINEIYGCSSKRPFEGYGISSEKKFNNATCEGTPPEKQCRSGALSIGTHNGTFHCDEVLACWMLKQLPQYKDAKIIRTRDMAKLDECDIVVDVGAVYDPSKNRFDHHQRTFDGTMNSLAGLKWVTKLSSAGLVYLHMGKDVISELTNLPKTDITVERLYNKIYDRLIEEVDAVDNGVDQFDGNPRYHVTTTLGSRVSGLNPAWNEVDPDVQAAFEKAMKLCGTEFMDRLKYYKDSWLPARTLVEEAVEKRFSIDPSGEIIVFRSTGCPWKEHLFDIEEELKISGEIKFVLFQDQNSAWRVQCVPKELGSFKNRLGLCASWCGLRDDKLSLASGIPDCIFVHTGGFIGGNKSFDGVLEMAKHTLAGGK